MSTPRERLTTALEGGIPDITPYSIYSWMMDRETEKGKAAWQAVLDGGLAHCHHCGTVRHIEHGVTNETKVEQEGRDTFTIYTKSCRAGTLRMVRRNGWHHEDWIKTPEGDMTYRECREAWPDKVLWGNLNVDLYYGPREAIRQAVVEKRERAGKRGFAFEISEDLPRGWEESVPIVLRTLEELG